MPEYKWVGPDKFYGIPPRDLTDDEFKALKPSLKRHVIASKSYEEVKPKKQDALKGKGE